MAEPQPVDLGGLSATERGHGVRLSLKVKPRSSRSEVLGVRDGLLVVAVKAPPVEGKANQEVVKLLARTLGIRKGDISITAGANGRRKIVDCRNLSLAQLRERLSA